MEKAQVFELLEQNKNERGMANWEKLKNTGGLSSFGIGLTVQRKLAKKIGKNRQLSALLWEEPNYDAKVISLLIDDPKQITVEQAERQVDQLNSGMLTHVFSSCDATLAKSPVAFEVANNWLESYSEVRLKCGYGLVYELSKKKAKHLTDSFFISVVRRIDKTFETHSKQVHLAMGAALMGIGKRNAILNAEALAIARKYGPIDFNEDGQKCDPFDVVKHLTTDALKTKLGITDS